MNIVQTRNINDDHLLRDESNVEQASTSNFTIHVTATSRLVPNQVDSRIYNDALHQEEIEPPENFGQNQGKKRKYVKRKRFVTIHECEYCGKVLQYPSKIAEHMRTHNGDRPFTCSICHASFTQAAPLKAHLRSHSNIKPYECKYCHKGFTTSSNRASHEKSCHDGVTYAAPTTRKRGKRVVSQNFCHDEEQEYEPRDFPDYNDSMLDSPNKIMVSTVEELIENVDDPNNVIDDASIVIEDMNAHVYSNDAEENIAYYVAVNNDPNEQFPISPQPLKFFKRADGSLLVGDQVLFPETLPDGQVVYNYAGSEENLHFILEDSNPILEYNVHEIDHPSEEMNELIEVPQNEVIIYEGEEHVEEGIPEEIFEDPEIIEEEYLTYEHQEYCQSEHQFLNIEVEHEMPGTSLMPEVPVLADPRPPRKGRPRYFKPAQQESPHFLEVPVEVFEMAAPKQLRRPKNERYQSLPDVRPARNLNWVIDAVAKNLPLEEVSPHVRKRAQVYTCEICGQIIKYPSKIEAHKRTHTGERPFPCEICGMSFTQRTTLRMHLRRHLNHKPFCCNIDGCTKSFISGALLNEHIQKRHAGHRFACLRNCGRIFRTNRERQKHEQTCVGVAIAEHINLLIEEPIIDETALDEIVDLSIDTNHVIYH